MNIPGRARILVRYQNQPDQVTPPTTIAWPDEILAFQGVSDLPPFESYREELLSL